MTSADLLAAYIRTYALDGNRFRQFQEAAAIPETPQNSKVASHQASIRSGSR